MLRSDSLSARLNQYVPDGRICPGTSTGSLNVSLVALSHLSAIMALGATSAQSTARQKVTINHLCLFTLSSLEFNLLLSCGFTISFKFPKTASSLDSVLKAFIRAFAM